MWYPNKAQWRVIWTVAILASFVFVINVSPSEQGIVVGTCLVVLGALLVWQLNRKS